MKKKTTYAKERSILNGTTTIVYGDLFTKQRGVFDNTTASTVEAMEKVCTTKYVGRGVAKLNPIDKFDETTGMIVASNKAELACNKAMIRDLKKAVAASEAYIVTANNLIADLEKRSKAIKSRKI